MITIQLLLILLLLLIQNTIEIHHKSDIIKEWYPYNNDSITISLHKDMIDEYQFTVNINNNDCKPNSNKNRTSIDHFIEREIGYDEILIELIGGNMLSFLGKYAYCGTYHKTFTLSKTGMYDAKATLLSVSTKNHVVLDQEAMVLMKDTIHLNKTFGKFCPKHVNGVWTVNDSISSSPKLLPSPSSSSSCMEYTLNYLNYYWDSGHNCGFPEILQATASTILSNVTINCIGDGNMSFLCSLLLKWACNIVTSDNHHLKTPSDSELCPNLTVLYINDDTCRTLPNNNNSITIANCGHISSTIEHFKAIIESVASRSSPSSSLLWLEMAPLLSKVESLRSMEMKNRYAAQHFSISKTNIVIVPTFHSLLPFYKVCENSNNNDDNHKIFVPIYQEMLRQIKKMKESRNE